MAFSILACFAVSFGYIYMLELFLGQDRLPLPELGDGVVFRGVLRDIGLFVEAVPTKDRACLQVASGSCPAPEAPPYLLDSGVHCFSLCTKFNFVFPDIRGIGIVGDSHLDWLDLAGTPSSSPLGRFRPRVEYLDLATTLLPHVPVVFNDQVNVYSSLEFRLLGALCVGGRRFWVIPREGGRYRWGAYSDKGGKAGAVLHYNNGRVWAKPGVVNNYVSWLD